MNLVKKFSGVINGIPTTVEGLAEHLGATPAQISRVVMSRMGAFQACFEMASAHDPTLKGDVGIAFSISPGGDVSAASITGSSLKNPRVEGCMLRTFQRLHFPSADKPTNAAFPFAFRASKK